MNIMKLFLVSPRYYPHIGGVEYVVKSIAERLAKIGHEVTVLAGEPRASSPTEEEVNGVHVIRWPTWAPGNAYHIPRQRNNLDKLIAEIAREADIVHTHSAHAIFPVHVALQAKKASPNIRLIVTLHYHATGHTMIRELLWRLHWRKKITRLTQQADKVHAVSQYEAELVLNHYLHVKRKLVIIPNGVEEDVLQYKWTGQDSDYMIYAGRIEKYKNLEHAVHIAKKLDLKLLILGEGSYKPALQKYAERHAPKKVEFNPPQPRQKYLELLSNARYAVNPSTKEAYSVFIAEALTIGTPCIASATIAKTLNTKAQKLPYIKNAVLLHKARINSWNEVLSKLIRLYRNYI